MDNNYMKTILSGVKEWTENLTGDAKDKANNALDKANNALDKANNSLGKALFVVNITQNSDRTLSADKTFDEIVQAYNEGKYNIVAKFMGEYIMPLLSIISNHAVMFGTTLIEGGDIVNGIVAIAPDNSIQMISTPLATTNSKLPNPYPLTFTGAVNETYDGSSAKTIEIPSGGGGAHSDWNQNDSTAADYIKNRPFYMGDPVKTDIIPPTTVTFSKSNKGMMALWPESFDFVNGQTYHVSWDGTDYVCTGILFNGAIPLLGNLGLAGVGDDTGEPFVFMKQNEWVVGSAESVTEHIIGIKTVTNPIVTLDEKYLPESSFTKAEWSNISNKIVDYKRVNSSFSVVDKSIHAQPGNSYSDTINTTLIFENGKVYRVSGTAKFTNTRGNKIFTFNIDVTSTVSNYKIYLGSFYDDLNEATVEVYLYSSNSPSYAGKLSLRYDGTNGVTYTFSLDITVNEEATVLPDICLSDSIQRVGGDIIIPSSTPDSTKKFKITVDDSGTITATEIGAAS